MSCRRKEDYDEKLQNLKIRLLLMEEGHLRTGIDRNDRLGHSSV